MKAVFMGTPEFSVACLERLIKDGYDVRAVFTQPDKPKGRGYVLTPPPVKETALKNNITVYQPKTLKNEEALNLLNEINPDIIIVVAYGKILPKEIIELPKYGCVNIHASLLPKYRGAAPIQWSVINGEKQTGITSMMIDEGLDTGDMLIKGVLEIGENETAGELHDRLALLGADILSQTMTLIEQGKIQREKQDDSKSTYSPILDKSICPIDWNDSALNIHNKIRGLSPWPVATAKLNSKILKIHAAQLSDKKGKTAGEVIQNKDALAISCGDGNCIEIIELQAEGSRKMPAKDFLRGHPIEIGTLLE